MKILELRPIHFDGRQKIVEIVYQNDSWWSPKTFRRQAYKGATGNWFWCDEFSTIPWFSTAIDVWSPQLEEGETVYITGKVEA